MRREEGGERREREEGRSDSPSSLLSLPSSDPVTLEIFKNLFISVAEEMGVTLGRTAYSPNIKERRDFSCACFLGDGRMIAQAAHIPVHLGAMPASVRAAVEAFDTWSPGDLVVLNDPYLGGTHLPDITMVSPVFVPDLPRPAGGEDAMYPSLGEGGTAHRAPSSPSPNPSPESGGPALSPLGGEGAMYPSLGEGGMLAFFVASRAHHADVGGMSPGSMPLATEIYQEGLIIPPVKLVEAGQTNQAVLDIILRNVRTPVERRGDLAAQMAAHRVGEQRLHDIVARYGLEETLRYARGLLAYAERLTRAAIARIPPGTYPFTDHLDDGGLPGDRESGSGKSGSRELGMGDGERPLLPTSLIPTYPLQFPTIRATVVVKGDAMTVDFIGSSPAVAGPLNAVRAITESATWYVARCVAGSDVPANSGTFAPVQVVVPRGSLLDADPPHAVAGGNVETSQRVVDAVLGALAQALPDLIPAASQGTMNNVTVGGYDPERQAPFAYYETVGGGAGGGPAGDGLSGIHVHMTNTLNTPVEAMEYTYPIRVRRYALRRGSGGEGLHCGGDGLIRDIEFLCPATVTILSERRRTAPYGLRGGQPGRPGRNVLLHDGEEQDLPGKAELQVQAGDVLSLRTPGGGGWGEPGTA
jgi:N-methylhydantoinase B/oxoprolinase/acetone carboxylase alpha subunit